MNESAPKHDLREGLVKHARRLYHEFKDDIPSQMVNSINGAEYKVRKGWFAAVAATTQIGIAVVALEHHAHDHVIGFIARFGHYVRSDEFKERPTRASDIALGNRVLSVFLGDETLSPEEVQRGDFLLETRDKKSSSFF